MVEHNLRFAHKYASDCARFCTHLKVDDLFQEAVIGLQMALDRFSERHNAGFLTYAKFWVRQKVQRAIRMQEHPIHIPENLQRDIANGRPKKYAPMARESRQMIYLDEGPHPGAQEADDFERYGFQHGTVASTEHDDRESIGHINYLIKTGLRALNKREREIIKRRFGLVGGRDPQTLKEVGERYDLTRERIRQLQDIALKKLREALEKAA